MLNKSEIIHVHTECAKIEKFDYAERNRTALLANSETSNLTERECDRGYR